MIKIGHAIKSQSLKNQNLFQLFIYLHKFKINIYHAIIHNKDFLFTSIT